MTHAVVSDPPVIHSGPPAFLTQGWGSTYQAWQQPTQQVPSKWLEWGRHAQGGGGEMGLLFLLPRPGPARASPVLGPQPCRAPAAVLPPLEVAYAAIPLV